MDGMLAMMRDAWAGAYAGASGPMPATPPHRPRLLFGGFAPATFARAARFGDGWVAPAFGFDALTAGVAQVGEAWRKTGRADQPRVVVERYFCFGVHAEATAAHALEHYYGAAYLADVLADTVTTVDHLERELGRLRDAGADDVVLLPCADDVEQVTHLADALAEIRAPATTA